MNLTLISNYVLKNKYYVEMIDGGYIIPRFITSYNGKNRINISLNREHALLNNNSSFSQKFEQDILRHKILSQYQYIKEFPIFIEDKCSWNNALDYFGEDLNSDKRNVNYFLLDFYFPYLGVSVEIDSGYHKSRQSYDLARDTYIKRVYGIETFRFFEYGKDDGHRLPYFNRFKNTVKYLNKLNQNRNLYSNNLQLNFSKTIINNFINDNRQILEFIDKIIDYVGEYNFYSYNSLRLSKSDFQKIDRSFNVNNLTDKLSLESLLMDNVVILMNDIYRVKLLLQIPSV